MLYGQDRRPFVLALTLALVAPLSARADAAADDKPAAKKIVKVAHIKLSGEMVEKPPTVDPLLGSIGETLQDRLDRIKKAGADKEISALLLEINGLAIGWGKLNELSQAIAAFRATGKKAYAHVELGTIKDYLLAAACDEVWLPESTFLLLSGIRLEVSFYKDLLEKLGIKADMLQMGDYKGAVEPFAGNRLSEPYRKQLTRVVDDYYEQEIVARIGAGRAKRKLDAGRVKKLIDRGLLTARVALEGGLVDRLGYVEDCEAKIKKALSAEHFQVVRNYHKQKHGDLDVFSLYRKLLFGAGKKTESRGPKVAVIYANGMIVPGKSTTSYLLGEVMGSETMVKAIREAEKDKTVKAIVLRVDSPGGSSVASDLIWNELKRSKKPVVASMADVAASGGYYISMAAQKIYAEPGTLTGSIGVASGKFATRGMWERIGIRSEVIARGAHSGMLTGDEPFSDSERKVLKALMQEIYDQFVDKSLQGRVKAGKKMTRKELLDLAGGRIWTGRQAKENGLVDEVGTLRDAILAAAKMGGLPADKEPELLLLPKPKGMFESMLRDLGVDASMALPPAVAKVPGVASKLRGAAGLLNLRGEPVWAVVPLHIEVK
jgi:protease-4